MHISFRGAAREVTGSCYRLTCNGRQVLIDCGLFQGSHDLHEENSADFGFDATQIDYVVLTHAHLDHCGRLPLLIKRGFQGEIISTSATQELSAIVLRDSAHLQTEEARRSYVRPRGHRAHREALYAIEDAEQTIAAFGRSLHYGQTLDICAGIQVTAYDTGHILGSASLSFDLTEDDKKRRLVVSGDLGTGDRAMLNGPTIPPPGADAVIMETTYGDRLHRSFPATLDELYTAISQTHARGGNVVIPTFALERAQEILYYIREGIETKRLPHSLTVFLDSPMAILATEAFKNHPEAVSAAFTDLLKQGHDPLHFSGLHLTRDGSESRAINAITGGAVILAGSGMCTGGRVMHHIQHNLASDASSIIFVGYAAMGTPARRIIDGAASIHLFGEDIAVRARIYTINGFSAHADRDALLAWHHGVAAKRTFLTHGDAQVIQSFANGLPEASAEIPTLGDRFEL